MTTTPVPTTQPVPENPFTSIIDDFVDVVVKGGETAGEAFILASPVAFLESPILAPLTNDILDAIAAAVDKQVGMIVATTVNAIQKDAQNAILKSVTQTLASAQKSGDQNAINQALQNTVQAYRSVGNFDGS